MHCNKDATLSTTDLAARVGLSQSPCWRRVNLLETSGVIKRRVALLSRERLGLEVLVFVHVKRTSNGWQSLPKFKQVPGVQSIDSRIVLEETKNTTELPIRELHG